MAINAVIIDNREPHNIQELQIGGVFSDDSDIANGRRVDGL